MKFPRLRFFAAMGALLAASAVHAEIIDIDNTELSKLMAAGVPVIDIRTEPEWAESGVIPGSRLLTFFDERGKADPAAWLDKAKGIAKADQPVIVICRSGNRTRAVSQFLSQQAGYAKVYNVKAGIRPWIAEQRPMTQAAPILATCRAAKTC